MSTSEVELDLSELQDFLGQAKRPVVQELLSTKIAQLEKQLQDTKNQTNATENPDQSTKTPKIEAKKITVYNKQIDTYAWDQSDKFMKIYITIPGLHPSDKDKVSCQFTDVSYHMTVSEHNNYSYSQQVTRLLHPINPSGSYVKVKTDSVLVMLKKVDEGKTWSFVTLSEKLQKDTKEKKKPDIDKNKDPQDSLMGLLKDMYEDGDDELKRTIKKAFYESRMKQSNPTANPDMPDL